MERECRLFEPSSGLLRVAVGEGVRTSRTGESRGRGFRVSLEKSWLGGGPVRSRFGTVVGTPLGMGGLFCSVGMADSFDRFAVCVSIPNAWLVVSMFLLPRRGGVAGFGAWSTCVSDILEIKPSLVVFCTGKSPNCSIFGIELTMRLSVPASRLNDSIVSWDDVVARGVTGVSIGGSSDNDAASLDAIG